ncbi:MAG: hypothetical protein IPL92_04865 [Saprospiraceae bacterium]|nr:hypothetical protein [Candidatus Opimibacter iunctus]
MKNIILFFCLILGFVGCHGQRELQAHLTKWAVESHQSIERQPVTLNQLIHELAVNPSAIYGDVFTNKSWK